MLHYLRNIRKKLIIQENVRKYLLYAVGEILLVVIGILLALQVNTWNEHRKESVLKDHYLVSLKKDLALDLAHFNEQIVGLEHQQAVIDSIESVLTNPNTTLADFNSIVKEQVSRLSLIEDANLNTSTFQALQSSGQIDLMGIELQEDFISLNVVQQQYQAYIKENLEWKTDAFIKVQDQIPLLYKRNDVMLNDKLSVEIWKDVDWPAARRVYYNVLNIIRLTNSTSLRLTENLKEKTEELLTIIETQK